MSIASRISDYQKRCYSSEKLGLQIRGALLKWSRVSAALLIVLILLSFGLSFLFEPGARLSNPDTWGKVLCFCGLNILVFLVIKTCYQLFNVFSLCKKYSGITWLYITAMLCLTIWLLCVLLMYSTNGSLKNVAIIGVVGAMLSWIFQDKIKGIASYLHLRTHHLLNVGDWIQVPSKGVDGIITKITLTTVTICKWDTTTSIFPINTLSTEHYINLQNMLEGRTYGRRMYKTFILDTGWFHLLTAEEADKLKSSGDVAEYLQGEEIREQISNAKLFRLYLYHWLSNHPHISQHPRLIVRWLEQTENGMPLQIYAFITDSNMVSFEWQQSQIIEHIIESLNWFGLRLYQSPSSFDVSNNNIYLTDKKATYR